MYINPYGNVAKNKGRWMKANFHTHAGTGPNTCGAYDLEEVIKLYKEAEYDILTITNHDLYTDTSIYKEKYNIGLINGFEYSQDSHMLCIGGKSLIKADHQTAINECTDEGGFVIICHPNWQYKGYWTGERINALTKYRGIEVHNSVITRLAGTGLAEDTWDYLLSRGKLVWGFGNDDFHRWFDLNKSWTMIYAESNSEEDVKSAIEEGCFYLSTGLSIEEISLDNSTVKIKASENKCYPKNYEYIFIGKNGEVLERQNSEYGEYKLSGNEEYVRVKVMGEQGCALWTQPIYRGDGSFARP